MKMNTKTVSKLWFSLFEQGHKDTQAVDLLQNHSKHDAGGHRGEQGPMLKKDVLTAAFDASNVPAIATTYGGDGEAGRED